MKPSTRKKRPIPAVMDQVRITRDGNDAVIEYADPMISDARLTIGSQIKGMTDKDIIDVFNGVMGGFWSEVQRVYENRIWTSLPSSLRIAWNGVLKPRHFLGVRLAVRMMSWISSSDTLSMSI